MTNRPISRDTIHGIGPYTGEKVGILKRGGGGGGGGGAGYMTKMYFSLQ